MVFKYKGVVPVRHVFEFNCFAGPMRLGYGNALQNGSFDCLRGHIGGGFNVLPVCSAVGIAVDLPCKRTADECVTSDSRNILKDAVFPPNVDGALRVAYLDQEM